MNYIIKASKSFLLMELASAIAERTNWLTFPCKKGRVRDRLKELNGEYVCKGGIILKIKKTEN